MKELLLSVCVTALMTSVYKALVPADRFSAQIKLLVACFFAVSVINALSGVLPFGDISDILSADTSYTDYSVQLRQLTSEEVAGEMRKLISEKLAEENIVPEKIYIGVNISDSGSISISEIRLVFIREDHEQYADRAVVLVKRLVGTKIKVTAETDPRTKKEREVQ
ncbi:MAG: hypothetical protein J6O50_05370 [Ruminiclostridium sp.]|nr:hypothetical protein [Ruminiclostridium sp.]